MVSSRRGRYEPQLELEGVGRAAFALIANCDPYTYLGRLPLHVAPQARFEEGLDVVAPVCVQARNLPRLATSLVRGGDPERMPRVLYRHDVERLLVRCDRPLPLHVDGEDLGDVTEVLVDCERDAVAVLV
jgi:diacylglycerol kinase family enzyme